MSRQTDPVIREPADPGYGALAGLTVLVTRPAEQAPRLSTALLAEGARVIELPTIRIEPPASWEPLDRAIGRGGYDWVIFTSPNGVRYFFERLQACQADGRWFDGARLAAIGPETARALEDHGLQPSLVPDEFVAEALVATVVAAGPLSGRRVLLPRAHIARDALPAGLKREGALVDTVIAYRTVTAQAPPELLDQLAQVDVVTFTSSSTVRSLVAMMGDRIDTLRGSVVACIGPITAAAAREAGLPPQIVAATYTIPGLVAAIRGYYQAK